MLFIALDLPCFTIQHTRMRKPLSLLSLLVVVLCLGNRVVLSQTTQPSNDASHDVHIDLNALRKLDWELACQVSTFTDRSDLDAIDFLHTMNVHYLEINPDEAAWTDRKALSAKLKSYHMEISIFGPLAFADPAAGRKIFEAAKTNDVKTIVADVPPGSFDVLDKLANEYHINLAIQNTVKPGNHWDVDALAGELAGRSDRLGACLNVAACRESGLVAAQCADALRGKLLVVQFADVDDSGTEVPLTTGTAGVRELLTELKEQGFKGICAIGFGGSDPAKNFEKSINAFSDAVTALASQEDQ
jgi:sugar phosphate isomerase/epimerase